jgi:hypothetical protein
MKLILYSKPGCHLCEGLQEKLEKIQATQTLQFDLELRDITSRDDWFQTYQYEIPMLYIEQNAHLAPIPRPSPRASVSQLTQLLQRYLLNSGENATK